MVDLSNSSISIYFGGLRLSFFRLKKLKRVVYKRFLDSIEINGSGCNNVNNFVELKKLNIYIVKNDFCKL